jgi:UPF0271 protein
MKKNAVDLNCDLGEGMGVYRAADDEAILQLISSANLACGFHAGDPHVMRRTTELARANGVRVGAHPGLPDMIGFGRRPLAVSPEELRDICTYQIGALRAFVEAAGMKLQHVIQHGALTGMVEKNESLGRAILDSIREVDANLIYLAFDGSYLVDLARSMRFRVVLVAFADRAYDRERRLVSRSVPGAVLHDPAEIEARVTQLLCRGEVTTIDGAAVPLEFDCIMLHGDSQRGLDAARTVANTVRKCGVAVRAMSEL